METASSSSSRLASASSRSSAGNRLIANRFALIAVKIDGLHADQVDHALQVAFQADGELDHDRDSGPVCRAAAG